MPQSSDSLSPSLLILLSIMILILHLNGYLLNNLVEGPLQLIVSGGQLSEVSMRLQDGKDNLVHLVHRLEQTPLNRQQRTINVQQRRTMYA